MAGRYLSRDEILRSKGLLDMMYTLPEIAWETKIELRRLREVLPGVGMPRVKDEQDQWWIHGLEFAAWAASLNSRNKKVMGPDEVYCMKCKKPVLLVDPVRTKGYMAALLKARCPLCESVVVRAVSTRRGGHDKS